VDPDEYLLKHGPEAFEAVLAKATDVLSYKWRQLTQRYAAQHGEVTGQNKAVDEYLTLLSEARGKGAVDALRWGAALAQVSRLTEIPMDELNRRFRPATRGRGLHGPAKAQLPAEPTNKAPPQTPMTAQQRAERQILGVLLANPRRWHDEQRHVDAHDFTDPRHQRLAEAFWAGQHDKDGPVLNELLASLEDADLSRLAVELVEEAEQLAEAESLIDQVRYLMSLKQQRDQQKLMARLRHTNEQGQKDEDQTPVFAELVRNNQATNLHRLGPVRRSRG
jgi:DNA primase